MSKHIKPCHPLLFARTLNQLFFLPEPVAFGQVYGLEAAAVKISDICGEMNPLVFSALEEVNLVFTLMVSSTVMVDIVFARFIFCTFYWR